jgi:hypothetical protein
LIDEIKFAGGGLVSSLREIKKGMQESEPENIDKIDLRVNRSMLVLGLVAFGSIFTIFVYLSVLG